MSFFGGKGEEQGRGGEARVPLFFPHPPYFMGSLRQGKRTRRERERERERVELRRGQVCRKAEKQPAEAPPPTRAFSHFFPKRKKKKNRQPPGGRPRSDQIRSPWKVESPEGGKEKKEHTHIKDLWVPFFSPSFFFFLFPEPFFRHFF